MHFKVGMTASEKLCEQAGGPMKTVLKKARISQRTFEQYATQGAPDVAAERLCWALGDKIKTLAEIAA